ncbi:kynureninase [Subtercola frigoramans]|uniref:Kynureninase n=1 Tax=Subtercola frigoramans TaxID=120298 RepID=A0ABS2L7R6_9MICO|nr:aminotransferase class V-fold PLP-dependent enzyme [Subtercola frigoramans]MBM7473029.1 kynureninase [Subtercola frigoramans]
MTSPTLSGSPASAGAGTGDAELRDSLDPLATFPSRFVPSAEVVAYLDGNSLGRPLKVTKDRFGSFIEQQWGSRLIRSWDEEWFELPLTLGDRLGALTLGAAAGQTVVADSTTVMLYKLIRAAVDARPDRTEIVLDDDNFPTDRFIIEGIARERGLTVRYITVDKRYGVTTDQVSETVSDATALLVVSHVAYRSGYLADMQEITAAAHSAGALVLWDLCHSAGVIPTELDAWGVDLAVGCTYKYLNGGPGSPAFGYVASRLQTEIEQPIWGWMGAADVFGMRVEYQPAPGMRRFISGTPPVVGMLAMQDMLDLIDEAGMDAIRAKSIELTEAVLSFFDEKLAPLGVELASPRDSAFRGSHVTIRHESFKAVNEVLWENGVIPDFRNPDGLRIGLSPLSTTFSELRVGLEAIVEAMTHG